MRIGVMLRHLDQHGGGVAVYTEALLRALIGLRTTHEYVLLYRDRAQHGRFSDLADAEEVVASAPSRLLWDQIAVPRLTQKLGLDVIFNPKYSLPLWSDTPSVFVCHGLDWYTAPTWSKPLDRLSHALLIPRYVRKATSIIAVSDFVRDELVDLFKIAADKVRTVHHGLDAAFFSPATAATRAATKARYDLPDRFLLYVGQIYPPKNFGRMLEGYARVAGDLGVPLLVAGEHRWLSDGDIGRAKAADLADKVRFLGWVGREDLPAIYAQASALMLPSLYEGFGMPIIEAMACGCPVLTAARTATREIAGDAGLLVDPERVDSIADGIRQIIADAPLRARLATAGRARAAEFSWARCAEGTLAVLEDAAARRPVRSTSGEPLHSHPA